MVFQCKNVKKGDTAYFQQLLQHFENDKVARAFYQYLKERVDVSPFLPFQRAPAARCGCRSLAWHEEGEPGQLDLPGLPAGLS